MNENLKQFVELNKDKVTVKLDSNGEVIGIESLVDSENLVFFKTNCKVEKDGLGLVLETIDGQKYKFTYRKQELENLKKIGSRLRKIGNNRKLLPTKIKTGFKEVINRLPIIGKKEVEEQKNLRSTIVNPIGNYAELKNDTMKLIEKLSAIFEKYSKDDKYRLDVEIQNLKERFIGLINRYKTAERMNDTSEMLNVKVKLVSLSGRIIAREKSINEDKQVKVEEKKPEVKDNIVYEDDNRVITKPATTNTTTGINPFEIKDNDIEVFDMKDVLVDGTVTMDTITREVPKIDAPKLVQVEESKEEQSITQGQPKEEPVQKISNEESADDLSRKKAILEGIEKSNKKVKEIEENITYYEKRLEETDNHIKNSNLDSYEISKFERVKKDYQEKLDSQKRMLEQAKEELKQNVAKLTAFMNEKVTYYVDGKPYKEVTRTELEKYKKMHVSDEKKKEDYKKQVELLKRRKELEEQLRENYEELKSLSTFSDDILYPKEEPSIEEIQETVRRFHQ